MQVGARLRWPALLLDDAQLVIAYSNNAVQAARMTRMRTRIRADGCMLEFARIRVDVCTLEFAMMGMRIRMRTDSCMLELQGFDDAQLVVAYGNDKVQAARGRAGACMPAFARV